MAAHEMGHVLQQAGRTSYGVALGAGRSDVKVMRIVEAFRIEAGERGIRGELGDRAWEGHWKETWAEAFSAYWTDRTTLSPKTRRMVEEVLEQLFPDLEG